MFDFRKVNNVADFISQRDDEEFNRSAISRYYYSLFCCARVYLIFVMNESQFAKGNDIHKKVCERLTSSNDSTEVSLGKRLDALRQLRNRADYHWLEDPSFFKKRVAFASKESKSGLGEVQALKTAPPYNI